MKIAQAFDLPKHLAKDAKKARRLSWITIAYLVSVSIVMYAVMGSSQAMKTAWLEDILSLVPPVVFLGASRIAHRKPNRRFPYGYHRAVSIAFLCASLALLAMGAWLLVDAILKLATADRTSIGGVTLFGHTFWLGWLMLPALAYSAVPAMLLGRAKLPIASRLHDKVLHTDADMNKADWKTATAAMAGVLGVGIGWWWADAVAAGVISLSIVHDGLRNLRAVITDLIDESPRAVGDESFDPVPRKLLRHLESYPWVREARVRLREEGHIYAGEGYVVVSEAKDLVAKLAKATEECRALHWRLQDLVLVPVDRFDDDSMVGLPP